MYRQRQYDADYSRKYLNDEEIDEIEKYLCFFTKDFIKYCHEKGIDVDQSRLKSDYEINKSIALMTVKYYR